MPQTERMHFLNKLITIHFMYQNSKTVYKTLSMTMIKYKAWLGNYEMCTFTEFTSFTIIYYLQ